MPWMHAERYQLVDAAGERAEQRAERERGQRGHERPLGAEPVADPAADGDEDGQGEKVGRDDPFDGRRRGVELAGEGGQRDVDDRRVQQVHEHAEREDDADQPLVLDASHAARLFVVASNIPESAP